MIKTPSIAALLVTALLALAPQAAVAGDAGEANPLNPPPPAAAAEKLPDWLAYQPQAANMHQAHRSQEEIIAWAQEHVTDALTLPHAALNDKFRALRASFSDAGWAQYAQVLQQGGFTNAVQTQNLDLGAVADGEARVTAEGDNGQTYQWVVALPVMLTYSRSGQQSPSQKMTLTATVARTAALPAEDSTINDLEIAGLQLGAALPATDINVK